MHLRRLWSVVAALAVWAVFSNAGGMLQAAAARAEVLIDFTNNHRDRDGTVFHEYEYTFEDWSKHVFDLPRRGVLIQAPSGRGGLGENRARFKLANREAVALHYLIGNANAAKRIVFSLEDGDGTVAVWDLSLENQPSGLEIARRLKLAEPSREEKPGKKPGLDLKRIATWQFKGDWTAPKVELLLIKLVAAE